MSSYHLVENALGSKLSMPCVNVKYGSALNDNGIIISTGVIKKIKMKVHIATNK
jgi:hypothetical protein